MGSTTHDSLLCKVESMNVCPILNVPKHTGVMDAHHGDVPGGRGGMASITTWEAVIATQLQKVSHIPGTTPNVGAGVCPVHLRIAPPLSLLSGVRPRVSTPRPTAALQCGLTGAGGG